MNTGPLPAQKLLQAVVVPVHVSTQLWNSPALHESPQQQLWMFLTHEPLSQLLFAAQQTELQQTFEQQSLFPAHVALAFPQHAPLTQVWVESQQTEPQALAVGQHEPLTQV